MSKQNIIILSILAISLSGCSSINKTATKLGVNFWQSHPKKAPCKSTASLETDAPMEIVCVGIPIEQPTDAEVIKLRGRYTVENGIITGSSIQAAP